MPHSSTGATSAAGTTAAGTVASTSAAGITAVGIVASTNTTAGAARRHQGHQGKDKGLWKP
ncbi:MAG: hypothetical protein LBH64_01390 [Coriobacteriales bacterium]|nr:hypothetical protein [Coriobacteriales bacterium]